MGQIFAFLERAGLFCAEAEENVIAVRPRRPAAIAIWHHPLVWPLCHRTPQIRSPRRELTTPTQHYSPRGVG